MVGIGSNVCEDEESPMAEKGGNRVRKGIMVRERWRMREKAAR